MSLETDYYLVNRPRQPKAEIADYMERNGFAVPIRYASLKKALASKKPFVVRSEHPQDYDGASGILDSLFVTYQAIARCTNIYLGDPLNWEDYFKRGGSYDKPHMTGRILVKIRQMAQEEAEENLTRLSSKERRRYCHYAGLPEEEFTSQVSYSYWEMLPGLNRTVVADNAIENRHHIFTVKHTAPSGFPLDSHNNHFIVEEGKVVQGKPLDLPEDSTENIILLVESYEAIRRLSRFPQNNCPIMELQSTRGKHYVLQYQKGRDFIKSQFELSRPPLPDEIEAFFVRGATMPEDLPIEVKIDYGAKLPDSPCEAVLDYVSDKMYLETVVGKRKLQLIHTPGRDTFFHEDKGHMPRSRLLKPLISAVFEYPLLQRFRQDLKYTRDNPVPSMKVRFISDGRRAYMRRLD